MLSFISLSDLPLSCKDVPALSAARTCIAPTPASEDSSRLGFVSGKVFLDDGTATYFEYQIHSKEN